MPEILDKKKKIVFIFACFIFAAEVLFGTTVAFLKIKSNEQAVKNFDQKTKESVSDSRQATIDNCTVEEKQDEDNDVLFIGCNGFF